MGENSRPDFRLYPGFVFAMLGLIASAVAALTPVPAVRAAVVAGWIVLPPVWFFVEYWWRSDLGHPPTAEEKWELERMEKMQDRAAKIWVAVAVLLAAIFFGVAEPARALLPFAKP